MIIGLFLKHIKAYKGINFIPIGEKYKFVSYIGENGSGKSSILEALDSYFNYKQYPLNKAALNDGITTSGNEPFIAPIFLIEKSRVSKQKKEFEKVSNIFWSIQKKGLTSGAQNSMKEFFEIRDSLKKHGDYSQETHYLILAGENNLNATPKLSFASFQGEEPFLINFFNLNKNYFEVLPTEEKKPKIREMREDLLKLLDTKDWKSFSINLKELFSYVYLPVEIEVESFTKIETNEMQKIFDKRLKNEIKKALQGVNFDNAGGINKNLDKFVSEIESILNNEYCYDTGQKRNNSVTKLDLVNKILEVYFQKRILNKNNNGTLTKVSELSAGEKRQALINLVYAFLKREVKRDKMVIIGIDEPENSLHTALCYDQFEKLKDISHFNQVLITTHWYGFLPVVSEGYGNFLTLVNDKVSFESYDLYDYRAKVKQDIKDTKNRYPSDFILKSTYDLVQSIFYSLKKNTPYNWIICEGVSEKIYFEYFFKDELVEKNLRILPMGGQAHVIRLYKYLETPMNEDTCEGKVYCLVDTDIQRCEEINNGTKRLAIRRLSNKNSVKSTELLKLLDNDTYPTDIEQSLNPLIFQKTIAELSTEAKYQITNIEDEKGNSDFIKNFKNLEIENYFKEANGDNKIEFAKKYIDIVEKEENNEQFTPKWVEEIRTFFN
ncbi:AAA family ATPase [Aliikangiella sp. G2MR2-5]|uniref:AAA family ATPase n=1 Tax=Aliikangiella sp. G2MR2-5 TaxID=2788943 RepID=UPI0018ABFDB3|nr:AAA family ATPase [Aliikangiella sp. G2MR2-5]